MTIQLDLKSVVVGLLAGVAVMLAVGAATDEQPDEPRYGTSVACNEVWAVITRIDTQTGEVVARREAIARLSRAPQTAMSVPGIRRVRPTEGR